MKNKLKIKMGIYGGSFNPPHLGHFHLAIKAMEEYNLDSIIFVPVYKLNPKYESSKNLIDGKHRLQMLELGIESSKYNYNWYVSDLELKRKGISYTVETLKQYNYENHELYFICGKDSYLTLPNWKGAKEIKNLVKEVIHFDRNKINISSTEIRKRIKQNLSVDYLLPEKIKQYINKRGLYK